MKEKMPSNSEDKEELPTVQQLVNNSIKKIKHYTGLDLKTTELVILRHIAEEVRKQLEVPVEGPGWGIDSPVKEISSRFLLENYGIDVNPMDWWKFFGGDKKSREDKKEWFRQKQDEMFKG